MAKKLRPSLVAAPILFLVGLIGLGVGFFVFKPPQTQIATAALVGGPFRLTDQDGAEITEATMKGKPFLVFFGFTHCPDICPTKLFEISQALTATEKKVPDIQALFISVDPERDTPDVMKRYLSSFNPRIKGLSGDQAQVDAAVKAYRAYAKKVPTDSGYTMDHTSLVYLMGRNGEFLTSIDTTKADTEVAEQIAGKL
jgi:protein SCO1/2